MPKVPADAPILLPFARPRPEPILRVWKTYIIGRRAYRLVGERWLEEDARHLGFAAHADPHRPGTAFSWRLLDLATGRLIEPVSEPPSSAEPPRGSRTRNPGA